MFYKRLPALFALFMIFGCNTGLKEGYDLEMDEIYESFDILTYLQEGGSVQGEGESIVGLLKPVEMSPSMENNLINFTLMPEDNNVRILDEVRYDLRRLRRIIVELRFPEATKVRIMKFIEDYTYSTPGGSSDGDLNNSKPVSQGGPYALVTVDYRNEVHFDNFEVKTIGTREYNENPAVSDFMFHQSAAGTQASVSRILTQGSYAGGLGSFTRVISLKNGTIASIIKSYTKDPAGRIEGSIAGNSVDGVVLNGSFEIETGNTACLLDDTGTMTQTVNYPGSHKSGKKSETASFVIDVNGVYEGSFTLENVDGSLKNRNVRRVVTRPVSCAEPVIRQTASVTGKDYEGNDLEISEARARDFTHVYGLKRPAEAKAVNVDLYRVSGQAIYR